MGRSRLMIELSGRWLCVIEEIKLSEGEIGYIAGLIDGEGTIRLHVIRSRNLYYPEVCISNTQEELMEWLLNKLPFGSVQKQTFDDNRPEFLGRYTIYRYAVSNMYDVKRLLEVVKPFLVLKKKHAELILRFIEIRNSLEYGERSSLEKEIYLELKELNKKPSRRCRSD